MKNYLLNSLEYIECNIKSHDIKNIFLPKYCEVLNVNTNSAINFIKIIII